METVLQMLAALLAIILAWVLTAKKLTKRPTWLRHLAGLFVGALAFVVTMLVMVAFFPPAPTTTGQATTVPAPAAKGVAPVIASPHPPPTNAVVAKSDAEDIVQLLELLTAQNQTVLEQTLRAGNMGAVRAHNLEYMGLQDRAEKLFGATSVFQPFGYCVAAISLSNQVFRDQVSQLESPDPQTQAIQAISIKTATDHLKSCKAEIAQL